MLRDDADRPGLVARAALRLTAWTERWIPDAFIFALLATILVVVAAVITNAVAAAAAAAAAAVTLVGYRPRRLQARAAAPR